MLSRLSNGAPRPPGRSSNGWSVEFLVERRCGQEQMPSLQMRYRLARPANYAVVSGGIPIVVGAGVLGVAGVVGELAAAAGTVYSGMQAFSALGTGRALALGFAGAAPQVSNFDNTVYSLITAGNQ